VAGARREPQSLSQAWRLSVSDQPTEGSRGPWRDSTHSETAGHPGHAADGCHRQRTRSVKYLSRVLYRPIYDETPLIPNASRCPPLLIPLPRELPASLLHGHRPLMLRVRRSAPPRVDNTGLRLNVRARTTLLAVCAPSAVQGLDRQPAHFLLARAASADCCTTGGGRARGRLGAVTCGSRSTSSTTTWRSTCRRRGETTSKDRQLSLPSSAIRRAELWHSSSWARATH
jgi:hypothetical protein